MKTALLLLLAALLVVSSASAYSLPTVEEMIAQQDQNAAQEQDQNAKPARWTPPVSYTPEQQEFLSSNRKIGMVDDQGNPHLVPGTQFITAKQAGWKLANPDQEEQAVEVDAIKQDAADSLVGSAGTAFLNAHTNQAFGGVPDIIGKYRDSAAWQQAQKEIAEESPIANAIGEVTGFITLSLCIAVLIGWKKLTAKPSYLERLAKLEQQQIECEHSWERIEKNVERIREILMDSRSKK